MLKNNKKGLLASSSRICTQKRIYKFNISVISAVMTTLVCMSLPSYASDIEIYKSGTSGESTTTIMFLLDISGSMDTRSIEQDFGRICRTDWRGNAIFDGDATNGQYCTVSGSNITNQIRKDCDAVGSIYRCYDRISRLRQGMLAVLQGNNAKGIQQLSPELIIGLSTLGAYQNGYKNTGAVIVPARRLDAIVPNTTKTQRTLLVEEVSKLRGQTNTPTTRSYAETVAYLMGTTTVGGIIDTYYPKYFVYANRWNQCTSNDALCGSYTPVRNNVQPNLTGLVKVKVGEQCGGYSIDSGITDCYLEYKGSISTDAYSGFQYSKQETKKSPSFNVYENPTSISNQVNFSDEQKKCHGQGVYVLTDGVPNFGDNSSGLINKALGSKGSDFSCKDSGNGWDCTLKLAEALLDKTKNPAGLKFRTAVVGFGSDFNEIDSSVQTEAEVDALPASINADVKQAAKWGIRGTGGWYSGANAKDVADSVESFVNKTGASIPSISTGSSTIPLDDLNPEIIQPFSYFPQFEPKVESSSLQQLWIGNLKKYYVVNNGVYSNETGGANNLVVKNSALQDLKDGWAKSGISYAENTPIFKKGGVLSQLKLGIETVEGKKIGRNLLTDYTYNGATNLDLNQISYTYTTDSATKADSKSRGLMALLGYSIPESASTNGFDLTTITPDLRQMGSVMHSLPVLLTQSGLAVAALKDGKVVIDSTNRQDYVLFGTTQGLLHVVDAKTGVEKFSFIPSEMISRQAETFKLNGGGLTGGKEALYYGMDGEWVSHTVYVSKTDGTLTVQGAVRDALGTKEDKENLDGKQWVYGGMRMGGRSYYALDLTKIDAPKIKFHIDPTTGKVYSQDHTSGQEYDVLKNMGQSWSKPKLDYINWKGQRKLVMFVGGGYDAGGPNGDGSYSNTGVRTGYNGYEYYNYKQNQSGCTTNDNTCSASSKGAGVYMFDADNGDLLWYADAIAPTTGGSTSGSGGVTDLKTVHITNENLKYSVVSEIKTVDRNNDGIVDHIYFGDLAGQAFRVDFKNDGNETTFDSQITRILNLHKADGTSPRFYYPPVFTAHRSAGKNEGGNIVVATFVSGNKSSPLLATTDSPLRTGKRDSSGLEFDGVYAVYEYEIFPSGSYYPSNSTTDKTLATSSTTASLTQLMPLAELVKASTDQTQKGAIINKDSGWGGWYYKFDKKAEKTTSATELVGAANAGVVKGIAPLIAMDGNLYVTMYDSSEAGTASLCGAGVKGQSFTKRICLPTGVCPELANYTYNLGAGIVSLTVGPVAGGGKGIIVPDPDNAGPFCKGGDCTGKPNFIPSTNALKFIPNRWYERYAKAS